MRTVPLPTQTVEFQTPTGQRVFVRPERVDGVAEATNPSGPATWLYLPGGNVVVAGAVETVRAALRLDSLAAFDGTASRLNRLDRATVELELAMAELSKARSPSADDPVERRPTDPARVGYSIFPHFDVAAPMPPGHIAYRPRLESEIGCLERARAALRAAKAALMTAEVGRRGLRRTGSGER